MVLIMNDQRDMFDDLGHLRRTFREECKKGTTCPVCDRWGHYDGRLLNVTMVRALSWMWSLSDEGKYWLDVPAALRADDKRTYDFSKQYSTGTFSTTSRTLATRSPKKVAFGGQRA